MKDAFLIVGGSLLGTAFVVVATAPIHSAWWSIPIGLVGLVFLGIGQFIRS